MPGHLEDRPPGSGAAGPQAVWLRGDRGSAAGQGPERAQANASCLACYTRSSKRQAAGRCACVHARQRASARASIGKQQVHGREQKELFLFSSLVISFAGACAYSWLFCRSSGFRV